MPRPRKFRPRGQRVSSYYVPWDELREVQAAVECADADSIRVSPTIRKAREAYEEATEEVE